jgi:cohesin loading factor subunit SCC2
MQLYLKQMLETFLHPQSMVRLSALTVVNMILRQGLVHPVQVLTNVAIFTATLQIIMVWFFNV